MRLQITPQKIDDYLAVLAREGKAKGTLRTVRGILDAWYESLPEEKYLAADTIEAWERLGREKLLAKRTLYGQVTTVKAFLRYLENPDGFSARKMQEESSPEMLTSREE